MEIPNFYAPVPYTLYFSLAKQGSLFHINLKAVLRVTACWVFVSDNNMYTFKVPDMNFLQFQVSLPYASRSQ